MNVLVVGSGGREHALVWKLSQSRRTDRLFAAPGNGGTAALATNLDVADTDIDGIVTAALENDIGLTVVGPEAPLAAGLVDALREAGLAAFGPTRAAARIESSKAWSKELMVKYRIPTSLHASVSSLDEADAFLSTRCTGPVAVKADGLAAGKGVVMAKDKAEAISATRAMLEGQFGDSGRKVLIEEALTGPEVSVFAFVDGDFVSAEVAACDYKRAGDGDTGLNTGGMGAYTPPEFWTGEIAARIRSEIMWPAAQAMVTEGCPFQGILYGQAMLTDDGPKVIEFNCRLGDPDGSLVLPNLESDLLEVCLASTEGRLHDVPVVWNRRPHVSVVMASGGYPEQYETGKPIHGLERASSGALIFHAGTRVTDDGNVATSGGRVLAVVAGGDTVPAARRSAYAAIEQISFDGAMYRSDIAANTSGS